MAGCARRALYGAFEHRARAEQQTHQDDCCVPAGGPVDLVARLLTDPLTKEMGQPIVVENKPGANGGIAAELVARGACRRLRHLPHKQRRDRYQPLALSEPALRSDEGLRAGLASGQQRHGAGRTSVQSGSRFCGICRGEPQGCTAGADRLGWYRQHHASRAGAVSKCIQGQPAARAIQRCRACHQRFIADQVGGFFGDLPGLIGDIQGGKLKPLGIAAPKRHVLLPDVKTFAELGFPGTYFRQLVCGSGAGQDPRPFIDKLNAALRTALTTEPVRGKLINAGAVPDPLRRQRRWRK